MANLNLHINFPVHIIENPCTPMIPRVHLKKKKKAVAHHSEFFLLNFRCTLSTFVRAWLLTFKVCTVWWLCNGADGSDLKLMVCECLAVLFSHLWHLWSQWNAMIPIKPHTSCKYFYIQPTHAQSMHKLHLFQLRVLMDRCNRYIVALHKNWETFYWCRAVGFLACEVKLISDVKLKHSQQRWFVVLKRLTYKRTFSLHGHTVTFHFQKQHEFTLLKFQS